MGVFEDLLKCFLKHLLKSILGLKTPEMDHRLNITKIDLKKISKKSLDLPRGLVLNRFILGFYIC